MIRRVAREVPGAAEQIAAVCTGHDYSRPGKPKIDWDDPAAKEELVSALVNDANALVAALADKGLAPTELRRRRVGAGGPLFTVCCQCNTRKDFATRTFGPGWQKDLAVMKAVEEVPCALHRALVLVALERQ